MDHRTPFEVASNLAIRKRFPFLNLPRELRDMIYGHYLSDNHLVLDYELEDVSITDPTEPYDRRAIVRRRTVTLPLHKTCSQIYHELMIIEDEHLAARRFLPMLHLSLLSPCWLHQQTRVFAKRLDMARISVCSIDIQCYEFRLSRDPVRLESYINVADLIIFLKHMPSLRHLSVNLIDYWAIRPGLSTARNLFEVIERLTNRRNMSQFHPITGAETQDLNDFMELEELRVLLSGKLVANHRRMTHDCVFLGEWVSWKGAGKFEWDRMRVSI